MLIEIITPEKFRVLEREVNQLRALIKDFMDSLDDEVDTKTALRLTGIRSRTTLVAERRRGGSLLIYSKHGRSVTYSRAGCLAYRRSRQSR